MDRPLTSSPSIFERALLRNITRSLQFRILFYGFVTYELELANSEQPYPDFLRHICFLLCFFFFPGICPLFIQPPKYTEFLVCLM